jgi:hypothetical protein
MFGLAPVRGTFAVRAGTIDVTEPLTASRISADIEVASFSTGNGQRDASVRSSRLLRYPDEASVMPYIGRSGWNTLQFGGAIPDDEVFEAVDSSFDAVVRKLPKKDRPAGS